MTNIDNPTARAGHAVRRPLCATCFRQPREYGSARCADCGPGRIVTPRPAPPLRALSPVDHAAELLGGASDDAEGLDR